MMTTTLFILSFLSLTLAAVGISSSLQIVESVPKQITTFSTLSGIETIGRVGGFRMEGASYIVIVVHGKMRKFRIE